MFYQPEGKLLRGKMDAAPARAGAEAAIPSFEGLESDLLGGRDCPVSELRPA